MGIIVFIWTVWCFSCIRVNPILWTHPNPSPPAISPQPFHSKLKILLFNKLYPESSSSLYLPVSTPNTIHHSRLTVCLPDSGSDPLPIDFILDKRLWISWFPRLRFCGRCRNLEITNKLDHLMLNDFSELALSPVENGSCYDFSCLLLVFLILRWHHHHHHHHIFVYS